MIVLNLQHQIPALWRPREDEFQANLGYRVSVGILFKLHLHSYLATARYKRGEVKETGHEHVG